MDSCPIILAKGPRSGQGKVAYELCEKGYNSSRKEWYYGIKLHAVVARKPGCLPVPLSLMASGAAEHDLPAAKQIMEDHLFLHAGKLYADKAYADAGWAGSLKVNHALELLTPRKKHKGDTLISGDTFSAFVSSIRQPIECFFNWLNRFTKYPICFYGPFSVGPASSCLWPHFRRPLFAGVQLLIRIICYS